MSENAEENLDGNLKQELEIENNLDTMEPISSVIKNAVSELDTETEFDVAIGSFEGKMSDFKVSQKLNDFKDDKIIKRGSNSDFIENNASPDQPGDDNNNGNDVDDDEIISYAPASSGLAAKVTAITAVITALSASPLLVQLFTGVQIDDILIQVNALINKLIPWVGAIVVAYVLVKGAKEVMKQKSFIDNNNNLADKTKNNVIIKGAVEAPKSWRNVWGLL